MFSKYKKIRVLITGVGGGGYGEQVLKALRLAETSYYLIGIDMLPYSKGLFEVDEAYVVPPASSLEYIPALIEICRSRDVHVLIHGSEIELKVLSNHRHLFQKMNILLPINTPKVIKLCMDKWKTFESLSEKGFNVPRSFLIQKKRDVSAVDIFPVIIKPSIGSGGSNNTFIAQDREELYFFCNYLLKQGIKVIVQEYIGTPNDEYTVGVLRSLDGKFINSIAVKRHLLSGLSSRIKVKNRTKRKELSDMLAISSGVSQGFIGRFPEVCETCEKIAKAINSRGPINIQCRFFDGKVFPFEINPRFSGTTSLRAIVGFNEPDILIRHHLLQEPIVPRFRYREGIIVRGLSETYIHPTNKPRPFLPKNEQ
jgi:carbamoyl-phosphate synthase large subunit